MSGLSASSSEGVQMGVIIAGSQAYCAKVSSMDCLALAKAWANISGRPPCLAKCASRRGGKLEGLSVVLVEICSAGGGRVADDPDLTWKAGDDLTGARLRTTDAGGVGRFATGEFNA
jgi:hypothetical protein